MAFQEKIEKQNNAYMPGHIDSYEKKINGYQVKAIRLKGFKGFSDSGWIEFKNIVLLMGNNSAGKSSISQALRMIKEAYNQEKKGVKFNEIVGLYDICGEKKDLISQLGNGEFCEILLRIDAEKKSIFYKLHISSDGLDVMICKDDKWLSAKSKGLRIYNAFFVEKSDKFVIDSEEEDLLVVCEIIRKFAEKLKYIGAERKNPIRELVVSGSLSEDTFDMLYYLSEIKGGIPQVIKNFLDKFGYELIWREISKNRGSFVLKDKINGIETNIVDNGLGVSQSLHIVNALASSEDAVLLVDSPELHLQPPMQSHIMDSFIQARTDNNSMILETGSEYMLFRLERRIAEEKLKREDVAVYYIEKNQKGEAICIQQNIGDDGKLVDGGLGFNGFFSSDIEDLKIIDNIKRLKVKMQIEKKG